MAGGQGGAGENAVFAGGIEDRPFWRTIQADVILQLNYESTMTSTAQSEDGCIVITRIDPAFDAMVAAADRFVGAHPNAIKKLAERRFAYPPWPSSLNIDMP